MRLINRKTDKLIRRLAVCLLAVVLVLQQTPFLSTARAQEDTSISQSETIEQQSSTQETSGSPAVSEPTPPTPSFDALYQTWLQTKDDDEEAVPVEVDEDADEASAETPPDPDNPPAWQPNQDPDEANEDAGDTNENPSLPSSESNEVSGGGTAFSPPTPPTPPTPLSSNQWWNSLLNPVSGTSSGSSSSQLANEILGIWSKFYVPTEEKSITTPAAGTGQTTGGIVSPASTSTATSTPSLEDDAASTTPIVEPLTTDSETLGSDDTATTTCAQSDPATCDLVDVANSGNGGESTVIADSRVDDATGIQTEQEASVTQKEVFGADSGNNLLAFGQKGEGSITTGSTSNTIEGEFSLNKTEIHETGELTPDQTGCSDCWAVWNLGSTATNENTGGDSQNQVTADVDKDYTVVNKKLAYLGNDFLIYGNTGKNHVLAGYTFKNGFIKTGNAKVHANVLNLVNTNIIDLDGQKAVWRPLVLDVDGAYNQDIDLFEILASMFGGTRGVKATATNSNTGADSLNLAASTFEENISIENYNDGEIKNKFDVECVTGQNDVTAGWKAKRVTIETGRCSAVMNLFSFLNTNIIGGESSFVVLNIFGDLKGDILLPDFAKMFGIRAPLNGGASTEVNAQGAEEGGDSLNTAVAIATSEVEATVLNTAEVTNTIKNRTNTGNNIQNFIDDSYNAEIHAGRNVSQTNVLTLANRSCFGCGWFSGFFNILGNWNGRAIGLPDDAKKMGNGKSFVVSVDDANVAGLAAPSVTAVANVNGGGEDSLNGSVAIAKRSVKIKNENIGKVTNEVNLLADTGTNSINAMDGKDTTIITGASRGAVNVGTVVNTDVIGGKLVNIAVNLFGSWDGDFLIGNATDVAVILTASPTPIPAIPGGTITYTLTVQNAVEGRETDVTVATTYDSSKTSLMDAGGGAVSSGQVRYTFTNLAPGSSVSAQFTVTVNPSLGTGTHLITSTATADASRGDLNESNNTAHASVHVQVGSTTPPPPADTDDDEGTVGGAIIPDNNPGSGSGTGSHGDGSSNGGNTGGQSGGGSTGGTSMGNATSGGGNPGNGNTATNEYFTITKSNTAPTAGVAPGSTVPYTVVVKNNTNMPVNDVKVYDKTKNEKGELVFENAWDLGQIAANEKITIDYTIVFSPETPDGIYINTVYTSGFDQTNKTVKSPTTSSPVRINADAEKFTGAISGTPDQDSAANGAVGGTSAQTPGDEGKGNNETLATRDSWTPVDALDVAQEAGTTAFAEADYVAPSIQGYETVQKTAGDFISRVTVPSASAAGFNPALLAGLANTGNIDRAVPFGGSLAAADTAAHAAFLMARTILFGLFSFLCFLIAIFFARRRKRDGERVHSTPYWML